MSGGGFRGLFTAAVLAHLEREIGEPIGRRFDLISGTSIGGVLALGLALELPAEELQAVFTEHGRSIFAPRAPFGLRWLHGLFRSRYHANALAAVLGAAELFGERRLGDVLHPVLIPTVNYTTGRPQIFKSPHHESLRADWRLPLIDVALATTAAPTYFPIFITRDSSYVDGGLFANMPGLIALHEAERFFDVPISAIEMVSIGTMSTDQGRDPKQTLDRGVWQWRKALFELTISSQEWMFKYMLDHRLARRLHIIDATARDGQADRLDLDDASAHAREVLLGHARAAAQKAVGDSELMDLLKIKGKKPLFHYGPRAENKTEMTYG